jgi:2-C-methyl-D-erythritol 4-phosphate cytidylyltransferase / 2-C-methyl-D-erythritol 2,4-cyclodiphosphate synthase
MSKPENPSFHVLIPAAGSGTRAGLSVPKQYCIAGGKMILRHTLEKFLGFQGLKSLRAIIDPAHEALYTQAAHGLALPAPVYGGATRKQSVANGLAALAHENGDDIVLIHDAARPFITPDTIQSLLDVMEISNAATLAAPIVDTLVNTRYDIMDRNLLHAVQTPQAFRLSLLRNAHEIFKDNESFTDDAGLVKAMGETITLVTGPRDNIKITTTEDMHMAEKMLNTPTQTRTGFGYDVHAFDSVPATSIRLGGIDIPHTQKLLGHSDADVVLHAITDALLGAIGEGDIGQLFPPSDIQWKGADSEIFVKEALRRVENLGGKIINADITLIAEHPKIGPHRANMINRLATMLGINQTQIGLKATTSEGLGFTGRGEGIVAQAIVTLTIPAYAVF